MAGGRSTIHKDLGIFCRAGLPETSKSSATISAVSGIWDRKKKPGISVQTGDQLSE